MGVDAMPELMTLDFWLYIPETIDCFDIFWKVKQGNGSYQLINSIYTKIFLLVYSVSII